MLAFDDVDIILVVPFFLVHEERHLPHSWRKTSLSVEDDIHGGRAPISWVGPLVTHG